MIGGGRQEEVDKGKCLLQFLRRRRHGGSAFALLPMVMKRGGKACSA